MSNGLLEIESLSEKSTTMENSYISGTNMESIQKLTSSLNLGSSLDTNGEICGSAENESPNGENLTRKKTEAYGPFSGQLISCIKDGCRKAFQTQSQRLVVAMYKCNIQATAEVLGRMMSVQDILFCLVNKIVNI